MYQIETEKKASIDEYTALLPTNQQDHAIFIQALNNALNRIIQFYQQKENEATIELEHILSLSTRPFIYKTLDQRQLPTSTTSSSIEDSQSFSTSITLDQTGMTDGVTIQLIELYIFLSKLKLFVSLNMAAFTKILKKYDKLMNASQSQNYMFHHLLESYPFQAHTRDHLDHLIQHVEQMYGTDKKDCCRIDLTLLLSDQVAQDRNTIWREKMAQARQLNSISTEIHKRNNLKTLFISFISLIVFIYLLNSSLFEQIEQQRCFAVLVFASILWATEVNKTKFSVCVLE